EQLPGALAGKRLDYVGELAAAVVAASGITFRVLVGEHRACGFQYSFADEVFRGNQLEAFVLAANFVVNGSGDFGIDFVQRAWHAVHRVSALGFQPEKFRSRIREKCGWVPPSPLPFEISNLQTVYRS